MKKATLWQISVTFTREAEEAVAALLERLFGQPAAVYAEEGNALSTATVYSSQPSERVLPKRDALAAGLAFLRTCGLELGPGTIVIRRVPQLDWAHSWKKHFKPIEIGAALLVKPSWTKRAARQGQALVVLDPGLSFGTGQHPTTSFCLHQLVKARKTGQRQSFLDIGTGSGILAISAVKVGYRPVRALDFDATAVRIARANARKNRVEDKVTIVRRDLAQMPVKGRSAHDVICANLIDDLLVQEREKLVNLLLPGGLLVLAGVLAHQFARVRRTYEEAGLHLEQVRAEGGWESGAFRVPG